MGTFVTITTKEYEKANALIKEATALKKGNVIQAIEKIKQAIKLCPDFYDAHFKLANYLIVANEIKEACLLIENQLNKYEKDSFKFNDFAQRSKWIMYRFRLEEKEKKHESEVKKYFYDIYFELFNAAISGDINYINVIIDNFESNSFSYSFSKSIAKVKNGEEAIVEFKKYLSNHIKTFDEIAKIYKNTNFYKLMENDAMKGINTDGDFEYRILTQNSKFCFLCSIVNETNFEDFFNKRIVPLL